MATKFETVYKSFLSSVDSYEFASISDEELEEALWNLLYNACSMFATYHKNIYDYDLDKKQFNIDLDGVEIVYLAKAMKLEWVSRNKNSEEMQKKAIGDRDYQAIQGDKYLAELNKIERQLRTEIQEGLKDYEYAHSDLYGSMA